MSEGDSSKLHQITVIPPSQGAVQSSYRALATSMPPGHKAPVPAGEGKTLK